MREPYWFLQWYRSRGLDNEFGVPIRNFARVDDRLFRGALPDAAGYKALRERVGIKTILNLVPARSEEHRRLATDAGIPVWVHTPFSDRDYPEHDLVRSWLGRVRGEANEPLYTHCMGGRHRTGTLIAVYRVVDHGWTKERAFAEMLAYGWYEGMGHAALKHWFFERFEPDEFRA
jgi:hypothetical protein